MTERWLMADWPAPGNVKALTTLRRGQDNRDVFGRFNLAAHVGDDPRRVERNRQQLIEQLNLPGFPIWLKQVHGARVIDAGPYDQPPEADAGFAEQPGVVLAVLTADCLPVLLCAADGSAVCAIHAGWRGLLAGIIGQAVARFAQARLHAWLGPAIGQKAFIVGDEVRQAFVEQSPVYQSAFEPAAEIGRWHMDLYRIARLQLNAADVVQYTAVVCVPTMTTGAFILIGEMPSPGAWRRSSGCQTHDFAVLDCIIYRIGRLAERAGGGGIFTAR